MFKSYLTEADIINKWAIFRENDIVKNPNKSITGYGVFEENTKLTVECVHTNIDNNSIPASDIDSYYIHNQWNDAFRYYCVDENGNHIWLYEYELIPFDESSDKIYLLNEEKHKKRIDNIITDIFCVLMAISAIITLCMVAYAILIKPCSSLGASFIVIFLLSLLCMGIRFIRNEPAIKKKTLKG